MNYVIPSVTILSVLTINSLAAADTIRVPADFATIQPAIDEAKPGDTVLIADGVYTGEGNKDLDFGGKSITVRSENGPANCIIDCEDDGRGFVFQSGESRDAQVMGLTITNGAPNGRPVGGGVFILDGSPTLTDCRFIANRSEFMESGGGGLAVERGSPKLVRCAFERNYCRNDGGGLLSRGGMIELIDCTFIDNESWNHGKGGGLHARSARLERCTFIGNTSSSESGGGLYLSGGNVEMIDCRVESNSAGPGAGMSISRANLTAVNCRFDRNDGDSGGAISIGSGTYHFVNCTFSHNRSLDPGGAIIVRRAAQVTATNCAIYANFADWNSGGGVFVEDGATFTLVNSILRGNTPDEVNTATVTYSNVEGGWLGEGNIDADPQFIDPQSGDLRLRFGSPSIDAADNRAVPDGVDIDIDGNTRFVDDPQTQDTGRCDDPCERPIVDMGPFEYRPVTPDAPTDLQATDGQFAERVVVTWNESLFAGEYRVQRNTENDADGAAPVSDWRAETTFDDETGDPGRTYWYWVESRNVVGISVFSDPDPGYRRAEAPAPPTATAASDGTHRTRVAITWVGNPASSTYRVYRHTEDDPDSAVPVSPWIGETSFDDETVTPGQVYWFWVKSRNEFGESDWSESDTGHARVVRTLNVPGGFPTIQAALDNALSGDTVLVEGGLYTGDGNRDLDFRGQDTILRCADLPGACVIDCEGTENNRHRAFIFQNGESNEAVVDGFTIRNGYAPRQPQNRGGAILCYRGASPTIRNCVISSSYAVDDGGAIYFHAGSPKLVDCVISGNGTAGNGGGISVGGGAPTIENCTISDNTSVNWGGGMSLYSTNARVTRSVITRNLSERQGGGIVCRNNGLPVLEGCVISENTALSGAGIYCHLDSALKLQDCKVLANSTQGTGGGIMIEDSTLTIVGSIVSWNNSAQSSSGIFFRRSSADIINSTIVENDSSFGGALGLLDSDVLIANTVLFNNTPMAIVILSGDDPTVTYSNVEGGWIGEGNIDADPLFIDPENGDFRLGSGSPSIDAADNTAVPEGIDVDLDGLPRFVDDPKTEDTGRCDDPCERGIVDMGAYEVQVGGCVRAPEWMCDGDVDGDGQVNPVDAGLVQAAFGSADEQDLCNYDVDCDNQINPVDAGIVQSLFGTCEQPRDVCP